MARAKRTQRAEARRRYRAATEPAIEVDDDATRDARDSGRGPEPSRRPEGQGRVGIFDALRISIHPPRFREDLALLPSLLPNRALWLPLLVTVASTVAVVATGGKDVVSAFLFAYFVQTPNIGGVFLSGFLAPRASWLLGAIVGLVGAGCYVAVVASIPGALGPTPPAGTLQNVAASAFILSPILGAFFASAAAWYRRFLRLSNPNRARQAQSQRRANDGRTRGSNDSQKAGARR